MSSSTTPKSSLQSNTADQPYANRHIPRFLALSPEPPSNLQIVTNGRTLTAASLCDDDDTTSSCTYNPCIPIWITDTPESIGMVVPKNLTMQGIADIIGADYPVSVIDVKHQEEMEGWTLGDLVEYFEDEERLLTLRKQQHTVSTTQMPANRRRRRTSTTTITTTMSAPKVLNQISLEFRNTPLAKIVKSPKFVRDLDWIDHVWISSQQEAKPQTQYYCLTSTAGCYTDFHVDFGGTSVWYHVLSGAKHFVLIPPTTDNLHIYEDWLCRPNQAELFLPDLLTDSGIQKVTLHESQTLYIPSGWIHAVYTPIDSLVIGGNFLHGLEIPKQIDVHSLEMRTKVPAKFRFPKYLALAMYAGVYYVKKLQQGKVCKREVQGLGVLLEALRQWSRVPSDPSMVKAMAEIGNIDEMLTNMEDELKRIERDGIGPNASLQKKPGDEKPKLRLKLSDAPRSSPSFRISIPSGSQFSTMPPQTKKRRAREELDGITARRPDDDEWKPSARLSLSSPPQAKKVPAKKPAAVASATKKPKTSRQRLMKRLR